MIPRATVLILTSSHLCRNPRVVKEADALGRAGYDVTVMSVSSRREFEQMDAELVRHLPFRHRVLSLIAENSWGSFTQRARTWTARRLCRQFGLEIAESLGPAKKLLALARACPADLTIAHTEIPLWATRALIADGRRVAVDFEDWYSEDLLDDDRRSRPLSLLRAAEAFALQRAAYTSAPSRAMAAALVERYGGNPPVVLRNVFPLPRRFRVAADNETAPPTFVWFSQTIGPGRGLEDFFAAWTRMRQPSHVVIIGGDESRYYENLRAKIPATHLPRLGRLPLLAPSELAERLADFDLGLALEPRLPPNKDLTTSNKIFQYLGAGLAVVATATAGQREVLSAAPACGVLVPSTDAAAFANQLDELLGDRARLRLAQRAARSAAEREFSWEHDSQRLLDVVAFTLKTPPARPF